MRILFISANPDSTDKLDLADELRRFQHSLQGHDVDVMLLPAAQPDDLELALKTNDFHVVHFSGHGRDDGILMRNAAGLPELVPIEKLLDLFKESKGKTKLAFLNACRSKSIAEAIKGEVNMVIGTNADLNDDAAKVMTQVFYQTLGESKTLKEAFDAATGAIGKYFPGKNVYEDFGAGKNENLLKDAKAESKNVTIHGLPSWDKHFHVSHIQKQISALTRDIKLDQTILMVLLGLGAIALVVLLVAYRPVELSGPWPEIYDKEKTAFLTKKPLLEWLAAVGMGIPVFIASFKQRFLISGNETLRLLKQMLEMVKSTDKMSPELKQQLHALMEQSVRGANPK